MRLNPTNRALIYIIQCTKQAFLLTKLKILFYEGNIQTEFPFYYGLMSAQGFFSPYVLKDGRCTFCTGNPFNSLYAADEIVDHIYITTDTLERVLLAKVTENITIFSLLQFNHILYCIWVYTRQRTFILTTTCNYS